MSGMGSNQFMVSSRWSPTTSDTIWRERVARASRPHPADDAAGDRTLETTARAGDPAATASPLGSGTPNATPRDDLPTLSRGAYSRNQTPSPTQSKQTELAHKAL